MHFLPDDSIETVVAVWNGIMKIVRSLPKGVRLASFVIEGPFPRTLTRHNWSRSPMARAVQVPLISLDGLLVKLVDASRRDACLMQKIIVTPQCGDPDSSSEAQPFLDSDKKRMEGLFPELASCGLIDFSHKASC